MGLLNIFSSDIAIDLGTATLWFTSEVKELY